MKKIRFIAGLTALAVSFGVTQLSCAISPCFIAPVTANAKSITYGEIYSGVTDDRFMYEVIGSFDYVWDEKLNDYVKNNVKVDHVEITGYNGDDPVITVPKSIDGYTVTQFSSAFRENRTVVSVTIQDNIKTIESYAFFCCDNLISVTIPSSVKTIGDEAFQHCGNLSEITLPDSIVSIGKEAFRECSSLTEIVLPKNLTSLNDYVFSDCDSLSEVELPPNLKTIGDSAFKWCSNLSEITIPETVKTINNGAFCDCTSLSEIILPSSLNVIPKACFYGCSGLKKVIIPDSVVTIGEEAFCECDNLNNIVIPGSVTSIGNMALGYDYSPWNYYKYDNFTISGYKETAAEEYAKEYEFEFIDLEQQSTENNYNAGDANCDNVVDLSDAVTIMQALANPNKYGLNGIEKTHITAQGIKNADVVGNNGMTTEDAGTIQRYLLHIIDELPLKK